jgi:AAA15 family ATPase/GTPase
MGATSQYLDSFKVKNFKRFSNFEMRDVGQFNLIVGDNNVGKTTLLEALLIDSTWHQTFNNFAKSLIYRNFKPGLKMSDLEFLLSRNAQEKRIEFRLGYMGSESVHAIEFDWAYLKLLFTAETHGNPVFKAEDSLYSDIGINPSLNCPFVPFGKGHDEDLTIFYSKLQKSRVLKEKFIEAMKIMIPTLSSIEPSVEANSKYLIIFQNQMDASIPLPLFGDGALKLFRYLVEMAVNQKKRLMIDEIDTGIHHSHFRDFWRIILKTARESDVQLFMTTHNEECIRYFVEVLNEPDMKDFQPDVKHIMLQELSDKSVKAYTFKFEELEADMLSGNQVRGGL